MIVKTFTNKHYGVRLSVLVDVDEGTIDVSTTLFRMDKRRPWVPDKMWEKRFPPTGLKEANALYERLVAKADCGTAPETEMVNAGGAAM